MVAPQLVHGTGRRKKAVARVFLKKGSGIITVNGKTHDEYFVTDVTRDVVTVPLRAVQCPKDYDFMVTVKGGGLPGQAGAVALGISRALLRENEERRSALKSNGLLTVDARVKERKKYGRKGARRGFQFVKR
jgi:small subunit ribosomal protein S9